MEYKCETIYTEELLLKYNIVHFKHFKKAFRIIANAFILLYILLTILYFIWFKQILFMGILVILIFYLLYDTNLVPKFNVKRFYKYDKVSKGITNKYVFTNDEFRCKNENSSSKLKYDKFYKAFVSNEFLLLYLNKLQAYVVEKKNLDREAIMFIEKRLRENNVEIEYYNG